MSQKGNNNTSKIYSTQKIDDSLRPPITNSPQNEISISCSSEIKQNSGSSSFPPKSPIKKVIIGNTGSSRVLRNRRSKSSGNDISDSPTLITPANKFGNKLIDTLKYRDNNSKKNHSKETNGVKKFSLINNFDDEDDHSKKKVKLNRSKKN
jgi:hypothetical protein